MTGNLHKWRGSVEDFTNPKAPLVIFNIPNKWLDFEYRKTKRKETLKDMIVWAIGADIIEGFSEIDDSLFDHMIIPVRLAETGRRMILKAGNARVVIWMSGLSDHGIQVKLFAKSEVPGQFNILDFHFRRPDNSYTKFVTEIGEWNYGVISEWQSSLPEAVLDAVR